MEIVERIEIIVPRSVSLCGKRAAVGMNMSSWKVVVPVKCNSWCCDGCRKRLSKKWIRRVNPQKVERFITLTVDPSRFSSRPEAVKELYNGYKKLVQAIRRKFKEWEYFSVIEFTKKDWPHIHILQRGSYVPQTWISKKWDAFGLGKIVDVRRVRGKGKVKSYLTKYLSKEGQSFVYHLRKVRSSKAFFQRVEKIKSWMSHFFFSIGMWGPDVEIACLEKTGYKIIGWEGDICLLKWVGWSSGFRLDSWSGSF